MHAELPSPRPDWCLFLDFDGTLVEIAEAPEAVRVERTLAKTLADISRTVGGALAIVSGRTIAEIDRHLRNGTFPAAGLHGLELRRRADGAIVRLDAPPLGAAVRETLAEFAAVHDGLLFEDKGASVALHYRARPDLATASGELAESAVHGDPHFQILHGKMVVEIKPATADKGHAVRLFMEEPPFAGRYPVFVGDDVTDEDGFRAAKAAGGFGIKIGADQTCAEWRIGTVAEFLEWLAAMPAAIERTAGEVAGW